MRYTFNKPTTTNHSSHLIELKPDNFNYKNVNLLKSKKASFVNINNTSIPNVISLLQLGEGFCLPTQNNDRDIVECIK